MSFAHSYDLQKALFAAFRGDPSLSALVGDRVYDESPEPYPDALHLVLGDEEVEPWSTASDAGAAHSVTITVATRKRGFAELKRAAGAVCAIALGSLSLERGRVVFSSFLGGRTRRDADRFRRIEMRFRIAIEAA